jgi:hypothetical protein
MEVKKVVEFMLKPVKNRKEIFDAALDRGKKSNNNRQQTMHIEKWILTEMLVGLKKLKSEGMLQYVMGEAPYDQKKSNIDDCEKPTRFEHCDLWWKDSEKEYWLEVKTIMFDPLKQEGKRELELKCNEIIKDLKKSANKVDGEFYHLSFLFPVDTDSIENRKNELKEYIEKYEEEKYKERISYIKDWSFDIWPDKAIIVVLLRLEPNLC